MLRARALLVLLMLGASWACSDSATKTGHGAADAGSVDAGSCSADVENDPENCGACGKACPSAIHASARCVAAKCARTPCEAGWFDFDGAKTPGCEAHCDGRHCTLGDGSVIDVSADPLPETGLVFQTAADGSSFGAEVQTSRSYTHVGIVGETTPSAAPAVEMKSDHFRFQPGLNSTQH